ncbi:MAG: helix-turn-helix transcriptional regulator [Proteobacteria bacterium]|nr:helix-turn-helix transcriptional regulator [Pseudomonadota bacterium]
MIQNLKPLEEACQNPSRQLTITIFKMWRERLKVSQKELSHALGFKSASMIHHFEKGLREASFEDFLNLMILSDDNVQGFIFAITQDAPLSNFFPGGNAQSLQEWDIYWSHHFISAVRQLMRTDTYRNLNRYKIGYFSKILNITEEQEHFALSILGRLGIAILNKGKPEVNPNVKILVPHNISNTVIKDFKKTWINQGLNRFIDSTEPADLLSLDLIPTNPKHLERITHLIRNLQNEIHNLDLSETNGFVCLGWMASFYRAENIIKA